MMHERLQAQLEEFRDDDEARWKYEAEEIQRQSRILKDNGRSDSQFKTGLKQAGINVSALEAESERLRKLETKAHNELLKVEPPPPRRGQKDAILLQQVASLVHADALLPPAYEGWGNTEKCGFNLALGEINTESHQTGDGWGIQAVAYGTEYCTLWFYYFPPDSGDLLVQPHVDFQGNVALSAHDHWYTSTHAELRIKLHFDLYQHYWDGEETVTIVDEHHHDSSAAYWVDDHRVVSKWLSVSANDIVWIKLTVSKYVVAHSSHAHTDCDFRRGADRRIRVEHIFLTLVT
jgi:hypothetical protein